MPSSRPSQKRGFTLLELIVVVVVLGVLAAIAIPTFQSVIQSSRDASTKATLAAIGRDAAALSALGEPTTQAVADATSEVSAAGPGVLAASGLTAIPGGPSILPTTTQLVYAPASATPSTVGYSLRSPSGNYCYGMVSSASSSTTTPPWCTTTVSSDPTATALAGPPAPSATPTPTTPARAGNLVVDSFDRANSTSLLGTTSDGAQSWQVLAGTWGISSNKAYSSATPASTRSIAVLDAASPDQDLTALAAGVGTSFTLRTADASNYVYVTSAYTGSFTAYAYQVLNGTTTSLGSFSFPYGPTGPTHLSLVGNTLTVTLGGVSGGSLTDARLSTGVLATATRAGMVSISNSSSYNFDNLTLAAATQTNPSPVTPTAAPSSTGIVLSWLPQNANIASYQVFRDGTLLATLAGSTTSYTDTSATTNTSYSYSLTATDASGQTTSGSSVAGYKASGPTTVSDTFDRATSTSVLGTTSDGTQPWQVLSGTWGITANKAYSSATPASQAKSLAALDAGSPDQDLTVAAAGPGTQLALRVVNSSNYVYVASAYTGSTTAYAYQVLNGTTTSLGSFSFPYGSTGPTHLSLVGNTLTVTMGGVSGGSITDARLSAGVLGTATRAGLLISAGNAAYNFDNLTLAAATQTTPSPVTPTAAPSSTGIVLSWLPQNANVASYQVFRDGTLLATTSSTATSYTDTSAVAGTSYNYSLTLTDALGRTATGSSVLGYKAAGPTTVSDTFDRSNSTSVLGTTSDGTQPWQVLAGTWGITANKAYSSTLPASAGSSAASLAVLDSGYTDQDLTVTAAGPGTRIALRAADANNYIQVMAYSAYGTVTVGELVNGSYVSIGNLTITSPVAGATHLTLVGNTLTVSVGGVSAGSVTDTRLSSGVLGSATRAGVAITAANSAYNLDTLTLIGH